VWLPALKAQLGELSKLHVRSAGESVTLVRGEKGWGVQERSGYPVAFSRLEELLDALARANTVEQKTARAEYLDRLGLSDIEKPDSKAVLVEGWVGTQAEALFRVLIGSEAEGRSGRYVRLAADNQAWLIDTSPDALASVGDWLDPRVLGLDFARVSGVVRTVPGKQGFTATRNNDAASSLAIAALPKGKKLTYASAFDNAARAVLTATVEDVKPLGDVAFAAEQTATTRIALFDGTRIDVSAIKREDGNWARFAVSFDAAAAPAANATPAAKATPTPAQGVKEKADAKPDDDPHRQAADLAARLDGWAYKISDYVYEELSKALPEYLDDDSPDAATDAADVDRPE
jgi:Domain of unknown function (DUF4340)